MVNLQDRLVILKADDYTSNRLHLPWGPPILLFKKYWGYFTMEYRPARDCVSASN